MDPRPINCRWPDCADYDGRCQLGANIHCIVIEGENLSRERFLADRPFPFSPFESAGIVLVTLAAIAAVLWGM